MLLTYLVTYPPAKQLAAVDRARWVNWGNTDSEIFNAHDARVEACGALRLFVQAGVGEISVALFAPGTWLSCEMVATRDQPDASDQPEVVAVNDPR